LSLDESSLFILFGLIAGEWMIAHKQSHKTPHEPNICRAFPKESCMINKAQFEEKWKVIRSQSTNWWSLMAEYDLVKVDKADVKFDKFVTMLQVKYGYTRQKAREEINRVWTEYEAKNK